MHSKLVAVLALQSGDERWIRDPVYTVCGRCGVDESELWSVGWLACGECGEELQEWGDACSA